jgi:hypothetical protein
VKESEQEMKRASSGNDDFWSKKPEPAHKEFRADDQPKDFFGNQPKKAPAAAKEGEDPFDFGDEEKKAPAGKKEEDPFGFDDEPVKKEAAKAEDPFGFDDEPKPSAGEAKSGGLDDIFDQPAQVASATNQLDNLDFGSTPAPPMPTPDPFVQEEFPAQPATQPTAPPAADPFSTKI